MSELKGKTLKITEDLLNKVNAIQQEFDIQGLQVNDMVQKMVDLYEIEKTKQDVPAIALELESLQSLTQKIFSTYLNLGRNIDTSLKLKEEELAKKIAKADQEVNEANAKLFSKEADFEALQEAFNNLVQEKNAADIRIKELTDTVNTKQELVDQYKEKNDTLTEIINEYKEYKKENFELEHLIHEKIDELRQAQSTVSTLDGKVTLLKERMEAMDSDNKAKVQTLTDDHKAEIERITKAHDAEIKSLKDTTELEKGKALLEADQKHQKALTEEREKFNSKNEALSDKYDKAREQIDNLKEEIRGLVLNSPDDIK